MKTRLEWKVGLFVFISLALLGVLLLQFSKGLTFFRPTKAIYLNAANVGGLKLRAGVLMSGVQVGTVSGIQLAPDGKSVRITLRIFSEYAIHKDARFVIEQSGFLGDQYVAIMPTENKAGVFENGDVAQAETPFNLQEFTRSASGFIVRIDDTARKLNDSLVDVRRLLLNPETLTNLAASIANLRVASERAAVAMGTLNDLVATNSPALAQSGTNLALFSERMSRFADSLNNVLATNSTEIHAAVKNIESSSAVLNSLLSDVQAGKGLAGTLLKDQQLAASVAQMAENLSITSSNLNRLGVWGILWQHKPPHTNTPPAAPLAAPKNPFDQAGQTSIH